MTSKAPKPGPLKKTVPSNSRELVPVGPRHLSSKKNHNKRDENGGKPTTSRALILRNGKHGARGTGEVILTTKITGWEKLELLADDLVAKSKKAVLSPFRLEHCLKIAESQFHAYLDEIANLQDPDLFYSSIEAEYQSRIPQKSEAPDQRRNASYMASIVATRIHNMYFLASAWHIVLDTLRELEAAGLTDRTVRSQLRQNEGLRNRYLVLYEMVNVLVNTSQAKFSVLATTTPHYSRYFKHSDNSDPTDPEVVFDWAALRDACKSFLDSIVIELCFPRAPYPKPILYQILHDAVAESPREANRFPQALWDAVGDLSVTVELQDLLERPLMGPEGDAWKQLPREMPEQYERWVEAQIFSEKASNKFANFKDIIYPLEKSRKKHVLDNMWRYVNLNYKEVSGMDIDTLWQLDEEHNRTPHWHSFFIPGLGVDSDDDSDLPASPLRKTRKKTLALTNAKDDTDASMPGLQSVSNSSEESDDLDDENDGEVSDESGYDTEEEDMLREMLREAMDIASEQAFFDSGPTVQVDPAIEERKGNPFLKLLGSLRGRMFSANPKLRTTDHSETRSPQTTAKPVTEPHKTPSVRVDDDKKISQPTGPQKTTVEDAEDEDDVIRSPKKKKKKPKKKKTTSSVAEAGPNILLVAEPPPVTPSPAKSPESVPKSPPASPPGIPNANGSTSPRPSVRSPSSSASTTTLPHLSSVSLSLPVEPTVAQSSRSYLQAEKLEASKSKVKSRPDQQLEPVPEKKKGFFSKLTKGKDKLKDPEPEKKGSKQSWFSRLTKKTNGYMHQLLRTSEDETRGIAPMKWDHFLKVMREMGFKFDPSTAGSSVRFDPPDSRDRPITFHKPHPDPTLSPIKVKQFGKRLKDYYGWCEADFLKPAA